MSQDESPQADTVIAPEPEAGRAELRRAAFLRAAREVFLEFGYEQANMAEIVRRAGGSLSTLYAQFGGKQGLFEAMIDSRVSELTEQMGVELAAHAPLREGLQRIGEAFLTKQTHPDNLDTMRLMAAQAKKFPEVAETWSKRAPEAVRKALAGYLEDRVKAGEIKIENYDLAASIYFDLVRSRIQFRAIMLPSYRPTEQEIHDTVARAVKVFLGGIEAL
ncbi:MAG: TetR/AcrR family transcriptional regulator [Alphaproteobacteria bacterium]|jgi:AcrR family transcriptional regulator|nr:MAG: TetR/AcrR family transcriptional regulator [Alphaproteobacteria bacterium]RYY95639.1 MAG: TetR/AcrR family transcriptional regulator [Alphaproteobacteria bacterium]